MSEFAKLFTVDGIGQIVVMQDTNDDCKPTIFFYFQPKDLGTCNFALVFSDDDAGWDKCDSAFEKVDLEMAESVVRMQMDMLGAARK